MLQCSSWCFSSGGARYVPITGDVSFDHLVKIVSARFLQEGYYVILFVINKYLVGEILCDYTNISFLTKLSPTGFIILSCFLPETIIYVAVAKLMVTFLKFDIVVQEQYFSQFCKLLDCVCDGL